MTILVATFTLKPYTPHPRSFPHKMTDPHSTMLISNWRSKTGERKKLNPRQHYFQRHLSIFLLGIRDMPAPFSHSSLAVHLLTWCSQGNRGLIVIKTNHRIPAAASCANVCIPPSVVTSRNVDQIWTYIQNSKIIICWQEYFNCCINSIFICLLKIFDQSFLIPIVCLHTNNLLFYYSNCTFVHKRALCFSPTLLSIRIFFILILNNVFISFLSHASFLKQVFKL